MTEAEAKTKWCPFVRNAHAKKSIGVEFLSGVPGFNRIQLEMGRTERAEVLIGNCVGSQCACWISDAAIQMNDSKEMLGTGFCGLIK